ncbi:hypothetical protein EG329_005682 [Mollisiaceae sp. DMI_Dod_QoI]|nr:hypothetical protein EG329_005682 [Helotiales sp. DMI_Dod_QoI]
MASSTPEDRFTTHWGDPYHDQQALEYAARKGISYFGNQSFVLKIGSQTGAFVPTYFNSINGPFDSDAYQAANRASDAEIQARHQADPERATGTSIVEDGWDKATRGCKLRTSDHHRATYEEDVASGTLRQEEYGERARQDPDDADTFIKLLGWKSSIVVNQKMLDMVDRLEQLVVEETQPGWNWRTGIEAQMRIRREQAKLAVLLKSSNIRFQ